MCEVGCRTPPGGAYSCIVSVLHFTLVDTIFVNLRREHVECGLACLSVVCGKGDVPGDVLNTEYIQHSMYTPRGIRASLRKAYIAV